MYNADVGVIVGRFQVDTLHNGHMQLIKYVQEHHEHTIICLGQSLVGPTKNNPLDFRTRKKMLEATFSGVTVLPIKDCRTDEVWSHNLDTSISGAIGVEHSVILYGSRDSFIKHYTGQYPCMELRPEMVVSGSVVRESLKFDPDFYNQQFCQGAIWATQNQYNSPVATVDIALIHINLGYDSIVLGQKKDEDKWRLPGGFVDCGETLEEAAKRETKEEVGVECFPKYLGSCAVDDYRYRGESNNIVTALFSSTTSGKLVDRPKLIPNDDLPTAKWFNLEQLPEIVPNHQALIQKVQESL